MVPRPWFLGAAQSARAHAQADLAIHLTLGAILLRWYPLRGRYLEQVLAMHADKHARLQGMG